MSTTKLVFQWGMLCLSIFVIGYSNTPVSHTLTKTDYFFESFADTTRDTVIICDPAMVGETTDTLTNAAGGDSIILTTFLLPPFEQLGLDIDGEVAGDQSGSTVALSSNGIRIAIGSRLHEGSNFEVPGHTRLFEWDMDSLAWLQLGSDIEGEGAFDLSGHSVSLSANGQRVAIGAPENEGIGTGAGHVRIFEWNVDSLMWIQMGADIDGKREFEFTGYSVSLSDKGNILALGAPFVVGTARVYHWNSDSSEWIQLGQDIEGESILDAAGLAVAISGQGTRVVVGSPGNNENGPDAGQVEIYDWVNDSLKWIQMGSDLNGLATDDNFGFAVDINAEGNRIIISAPRNDEEGNNAGKIQIYEWDSTGQNWIQLGQDINGQNADDFAGRTVSISSTGNRIVIGIPENDANGFRSGQVRIFDWNQDSLAWLPYGRKINGEMLGDGSGSAVSISGDGSLVAIGAESNDGNGANSGHTRVFELETPVDTFFITQAICDSIAQLSDTTLFTSASGGCDSLVITTFADTCFLNTSIDLIEHIGLGVAPNPFKDKIQFQLYLPKSSQAKIMIYNNQGMLIRELEVEKVLGRQKILWDGRDQQNRVMPAGLYHVELKVQDLNQFIKVVKI